MSSLLIGPSETSKSDAMLPTTNDSDNNTAWCGGWSLLLDISQRRKKKFEYERIEVYTRGRRAYRSELMMCLVEPTNIHTCLQGKINTICCFSSTRLFICQG